MVNAVLILVIVLLLAVIVWLVTRINRAPVQDSAMQQRQEDLEDKVHSLELERIKYKLNPHLFKNILNAIQSHAYQTYYALDKLSNVLDFILYESDRRFVSLKEEVEFALSLIEINRLKVSPLFDLRIKNKIDGDAPFYEQELVAPLITIDLIENAFKHADLQNEQAFISIIFELKEGIFTLTVSNKISPVSPIEKERSGLGRAGLQKRLSILYKDHYQLDQFVEGDVYIARLKLNLGEHQIEMHTIG
jgi:LytS/YehU family sensor histidine kinase